MQIDSRGILVSCLAGIAVIATASGASAVHFNRGGFVPAFLPCSPAAANATTSAGVPACAPAVLESNCAADPTGAIRFTERSKSKFKIHPKGRRRTRNNEGKIDIDARVVLTKIEDCEGKRFGGDIGVSIQFRMFLLDPSCGAGGCTLPDFTVTPTLRCTRGRCKSVLHVNPEREALGLPLLPSTFGWTTHIVDLRVLDRSGATFARIGVQAGENVTERLARIPSRRTMLAWLLTAFAPTEAMAYGQGAAGVPKRLEARYVQAFAPCLPDDIDRTTTDGQPACAAAPYSSCSDDPATAVQVSIPDVGSHANDGRGKVTLSYRSDSVSLKAQVHGLSNCSDAAFTGALDFAGRLRTTVFDTGCGSELCTVVDTDVVEYAMPASGGNIGVNGDRIVYSGLAGLSGVEQGISSEIVGLTLSDAGGNAVLVGPGAFVRCNANGVPNSPRHDELGFCFGN